MSSPAAIVYPSRKVLRTSVKPVYTSKFRTYVKLCFSLSLCTMTLSPFLLAFLVSNMVLRNASYLAISSFAKNQSIDDAVVLYHMERYLIDLPAKHNPLTDFGLPYDNVEIPSNDESGLMLRGWLVRNSKTNDVILCAHGAYVDKLDMLKHTKYLYDEGYSVLLLDVRDHGASDSKDHRGTSLGIREHRDLITAVDYLVNNKFENVILFGASTGASSSIMAAVEHSKVKAVIAENPFASRVEQVSEGIHSALFKGSWGENRMEDHSPALATIISIIKDYTPAHLWIELTARVATWRMSNYKTFFFWDPIDRIHELKRPLLLMHSERDSQVYPHHTLRLYEKSDKSLTELWMLPEGKHSMLYQHNPKQYQERVLTFLRKL